MVAVIDLKGLSNLNDSIMLYYEHFLLQGAGWRNYTKVQERAVIVSNPLVGHVVPAHIPAQASYR